METFVWPDLWSGVEPGTGELLEKELGREVKRDHILFGQAVCAIARRDDGDDVLFALIGSSQVAQVHLSYGGSETSSFWPATTLCQSLSAWQQEQIRASP